MNSEDGELSMQDRVNKITKVVSERDNAKMLEVEEELSMEHWDEHGAYDYVGDYKDCARYGAVGDVEGVTLGFEIECEYRHETLDYEEYDEEDEDECYIRDRNIDASESDALAAISRSMNKGYVLAERDGSLNDSGVEFVTGYCTWESHKPRLQRFFEEYKKDFEDSRSAGIHIHVGRNRFTEDLVWHHFYWFILCDQNKPLIAHVARRYGCTYVHANRTYNRGGDIRGESRYDGVNRRDYTWELRLFASTTDWTVMQEYAEFSLASVKFLIQNKSEISEWMLTNNTDFSASPLNYRRFIEWVSTQAASFPNLNKHLERM